MLFLLFQIGNERYVLEASRVVEVLPLVELKKIPQAPRGCAGVLNYRGVPVAALDLCQLTLGQPASERLSTRIILIKYVSGEGRECLVGLIAEKVTDMVRKNPSDFADPGFRASAAPSLGPLLLDAAGAIQWIRTEHLLTEQFRELAFSETPHAIQ